MSHDPLDGYTVDDLFSLPDLPPHTELLDGHLIFPSPPECGHSRVIDLLVSGLRRTVPPGLKVRRGMTVILDRRDGTRPDACVIRADADKGPDHTSYLAADLVLAIEVGIPESALCDHTTRPSTYAATGIRHYWLVDMTDPGAPPVLQVYEREQSSGTYTLTGSYRDHLKLNAPYDINIDLTTIHQL